MSIANTRLKRYIQVMHCTAIQGIGRLDNSLINKAKELDIAD